MQAISRTGCPAQSIDYPSLSTLQWRSQSNYLVDWCLRCDAAGNLHGPIRVRQSASAWRFFSGTIVKTADADVVQDPRNVGCRKSSRLSTATTTGEEDSTGVYIKIARLRLRRRLSLAKHPVRPASQQAGSSGSIRADHIIQKRRRGKGHVVSRWNLHVSNPTI